MQWLSRLAVAVVLVCFILGSNRFLGPSASTWWTPSLGNQPWQWELSHPLRLGNASDMGTNDKLPNGKRAPAPVIYDIDGIINPKSTITALARAREACGVLRGGGSCGELLLRVRRRVSSTSVLPAASQRRSLRKEGTGLSGVLPDIRSPSTVAIVESMIAKQCAAKGFDAVETDIDEEYTSAPRLLAHH